MRATLMILAAAALLLASPTLAQDSAATAVTTETATSNDAIDPARLAAAERLVNLMMPPDESEWVEALVDTSIESRTNLMRDDESVKEMLRANPSMRRSMDAMIEQVGTITRETMIDRLPGLRSATAQAYARHLEVADLDNLATFFATPTGRRFATAQISMASDPAMVTWTVETEQAVMERLGPVMTEFVANAVRASMKATGDSQ